MQILRQSVKHPFERAIPAPPLEPAVARLVGRVSLARKVLPACPAAKNPQNAVQDISRISPRAPATVLASPWLPNPRGHERPLLFRQTHAKLPTRGGIHLEDGGRLSAGKETIANSIGAY